MLCQGGDGCSVLGKFGPQEVVGVLFHVTLAQCDIQRTLVSSSSCLCVPEIEVLWQKEPR